MPVASRTKQLEKVRALTVLPDDAVRRTGRGLSGLRIDGRELAYRIGDRTSSITINDAVDGEELAISVDDHDGQVLSSGVLGLRVMTRVAEVTVDGDEWAITGTPRSQGVLTVTCEPAQKTLLKRHGRKRARVASRGDVTCARFCADEIRAAGHPVLVLDEDVPQQIAGIKQLRRELAKAKKETRAARDRSDDTPSRASVTGGLKEADLKIKGDGASQAQLAAIRRVQAAADKYDPPPRARLAVTLAPIGEATYNAGARNGKYGGLYQSPDPQLEGQVRDFLKGGNGFQAGGAIAYSRANPGASIGQIVTAVEASGKAASFYERGPESSYLDEARAIVRAWGASDDTSVEAGSDGAAWIKGYEFEKKKGESTYACCHRLLVEERGWLLFLREGVWIIASEPALARGVARLVATSNNGRMVDDFDFDSFYRGARVQEATGQMFLAPFEADKGEPARIEGLPQLEGTQWLISSIAAPYGVTDPVADVTVRVPIPPKKEPSSEVASRDATTGGGDEGGEGASISGGSLAARLKAAAQQLGAKRNGTDYVWGGGHAHAGTPDTGTPGSSPHDGTSDPNKAGFDCSGLVGAALALAGVIDRGRSVPGSGDLGPAFGLKPGNGTVTVWANGNHVFMHGPGWRLDTASGREWFVTEHGNTAGFTAYKVC